MTNFLNWSGLATLHNCCHTFKSFLCSQQFKISDSRAQLMLEYEKYLLLQNSYWARTHLRRLSVFYTNSPLVDLSGLPAFTRLIQFSVQLPIGSFNQETIDYISQLTSLEDLKISRNMFDYLSNVEALIETGIIQAASKVSFASLKRISNLQSFCFDPSGLNYLCTRQQMQDLIQIQSLTYLECGHMMDNKLDLDIAGNQSREQWINDTVAHLPKLLNLRTAILQGSEMSADVWEHITNIPSLTVLDYDAWNEDIDWNLLRKLKFTLAKFCFLGSVNDGGVPIATDQLFPALAECTMLTELQLQDGTFKKELNLIAQLPRLKKLSIVSCQVESLAFLDGSSVEELTLMKCTNPSNTYYQWAQELPLMPKLRQLRIAESVSPRFNAGVNSGQFLHTLIECYKVALASRMPSLPVNATCVGTENDAPI